MYFDLFIEHLGTGAMPWYVVFRGRRPGVYSDWVNCQAQVSGYSHSSYQKYGTMDEAMHAFQTFVLAQHGFQQNSQDESSSSYKNEGFKLMNADKAEQKKNNVTWRDVLLLLQIIALVVVAIVIWLK